VVAGIGLRVAAALRPGLWGDEIFSLAVATGHSLEHPASVAEPALGDYVEPPDPQPPPLFRRYAEEDSPPAGVRRVVRAVFLSDTSPPLYYVLLNAWTRPFGTSDAALRLLSVACAVLTIPLLWLIGRDVGQRRMAWSACVLFSCSAVAIYNSAEGRMYALLWLLVSGLAWLTLRLSRPGPPSDWTSAAWVFVGTAGLYTHYFFAFVWLACVGWLGVSSHRRGRVALLAGLTLLAVVPWYLQVPASLAQWRVTAGWQDGSLAWPEDLARPFLLAAGLLAGRSPLGGWPWADYLVGGLLLVTGIWIVRRGLIRRLVCRRCCLLWAWLGASCAGLLAFDLLRHTTTSYVDRYALPALPAAILLTALALSRLPPRLHLLVLSAIVIAWLPGARAAVGREPRPQHPFRQIDARLRAWARPGDLVLVHSVPTGVIGVARYLDAVVPLAAWTVQLELRPAPRDLERLLTGYRRLALVKVHYRGLPAPAEAWLESHARLTGRDTFPASSAQVLYFEAARPGGLLVADTSDRPPGSEP
jgi:4-amino-4-deoxy-L-arabinose transferase-like glycosyltransferase